MPSGSTLISARNPKNRITIAFLNIMTSESEKCSIHTVLQTGIS